MQNLLDPAILFFVFGIFAGAVRSNLEIPAPISRFLSLYLLMALGLKGGFALAHSGLRPEVVNGLACAVLLAVLVPVIGYNVLQRVVSRFDAVAIAATYGSVSAVTFITTTQYLETHHLPYGGHMAAAMALMESPAIIMAVAFANVVRASNRAAAMKNGVAVADAGSEGFGLRKVLHEALTDGAQMLLLGAMVVGLISGDAGKTAMQPFTGDLFRGMLAFFLLDMGLLAARNMPGLRGKSPWLIAYAVVAPVIHAGIALALAKWLAVPAGDASLLMVLGASASYIAVPAVLRYAIPEADPLLYFGLSLGVTFPINILIGIPVYVNIAHAVLS